MPKFLETESGRFLNLDHVVEFQSRYRKDGSKDDTWYFVAVGANGRDLNHRCRKEEVERLSSEIIPAYSGFTLLFVWFDLEPQPSRPLWGITREPIIGWRVSWLGTDPLIANDGLIHANGDVQAILYPTGRIVMPYDRCFDNEEQFVEYLNEKAQEFKQQHKLRVIA